jgi:hypothetical protein
MSIFSWIGKQLMKPSGVVAKELKTVGDTIGNLISIASPKISASQGIKNIAKDFIANQKGAYNVIIGKEETSISKEMKKAKQEANLMENILDKAVGIGSDLVLDPLNLIGGKFAKGIIKGVERGAKVVKILEPIKKISKAISDSEATKKVISLFSNATSNAEFNAVVNKFRNLRDYKEANLIQQATDIAQKIKKLGKESEGIITEGLENPSSLINIKDKRILDIVKELKTTYSDFLNKARITGLTVGEIMNYAPHIRTKESLAKNLAKQFGIGAKEFSTAGIEKGRKLEGTIKELTEKGIDIFEKNPAIQLVKKGQVYAKAITSKMFANEVKKFSVKDGVKVSNPLLKELKFLPEHAKVIDNFYQTIKPEELNVIIRTFDKIQNWWKAQALIAPSYHIRNEAGNIWNNFIANVNPGYYIKAIAIQSGKLKNEKIIDDMKRLGVINEGWYAKDIGEEVLRRVSSGVKEGINPLSQQNYLFRINKAIGSAIENNSRIAHYLSKLSEGLSPEKAAESVKKYLFDYGDLTNFEKTIMKRIVPFYTWTRKNLPLQLSNLITQPAKYVLPHKIIREIESGTERPNEKYMSEYIKSNIPVLIRKNKEGDAEYFMLGTWLPYASAIDFLSQPLQNTLSSVSPLIKTPLELFSNKSTFFKNTLGEYSNIENQPLEQGQFLGQTMRKKNITLLRNIRLLNEMDKWIKKQDPMAIQDSFPVKILNLFFGKTATYDIKKSKYFYDLDTENRRRDYENAIRQAKKKGDKNQAKKLINEMKSFIKERNKK